MCFMYAIARVRAYVNFTELIDCTNMNSIKLNDKVRAKNNQKAVVDRRNNE